MGDTNNMDHDMKVLEKRIGALVVVGLIACSNNGSSSTQPPRATNAAEGGVSSGESQQARQDAEPSDGMATNDGSGIRGRVKVLEGTAKGQVLIALPGSAAVVKSAKVQSDGSFHVAGLEPDTYRLILPADGYHSTADVYVTIDAENPQAEVDVVRGKGCPVTITVRDHANTIVPGAELQLTLTDLPHVESPQVHRSTTDEQGKIVITGSCVRGFYKGTLSVKGRGSFDIDHGYVGTGRDQFDIVLPEQADAGVTYANDD